MSSILSLGGRFHITRNLVFTLSMNETDSAERRLYPPDVTKSTSMTEFRVTGSSVLAIDLTSVCHPWESHILWPSFVSDFWFIATGSPVSAFRSNSWLSDPKFSVLADSFKNGHSPNYWMFFSWVCNVRHSFLSFSHLIFYFIHKFCCVTSHDESFGTCLFLVISTIKLPRSIMNYLPVPYGMRISVEKSISMMRTNLMYCIWRSFIRFPWSIVRRNLTFPLLRRPRTSIIQFWITCWGSLSSCPDRSSTTTDFPGSWYPYHVFPGLDEVEDDTTDGILALRFIIGLDFAVTRSSPESCWDRFAIISEQTVELKWLMLNNLNKWFHSSRVKFHFVKMSASWFLVSMYLIWILGVQVISVEQPVKSMIILITASMSSKMYNIGHFREDVAFEEAKSTLDNSRCSWESWVLACEFNCFLDALLCNGSHPCLLVFLFMIRFWMHDINKIPKIKRGNTVHA